MAAHDSELEPLSREECLRLVGTMSIGRIAVAQPGGPPLVVPVNYALEAEVIVFRTDPGSKLDALRDQPISFQVDLVDPVHRTGWSVLVQGAAYETSPGTKDPEPWAGGPKEHWVRLFPGVISGRRIRLADVHADDRGYL